FIKQRLQGKQLRPFQQKIAATPHRITLVKAGCGTGKTVGAYAWAKKWAGDRKLFFGYPTTGTATQGFIDYAHETKIEADLMHSRADLDREILFSGDEDEGIEDRLAALTAWRQKLIVCTVDTVLGLMQNNRRSLYSWSAIAQAAFVFDEVHAYDHRLFGALLRFLDTFRGAPILLMSASFTEEQIKAIQGVVGELGEETQIIEGPKNLEVLSRYQIESIPSADNAWQKVRETLTRQHQNKVLWVTNSVNTCRELY
ncbi:MAG: CRISPR-associated helicase Cas3, partial [Coleofasciculus sp. C2-GNP5-27]